MKILITTIHMSGIGGIETSLMNLLEKIHTLHAVDLCVLANYISPKTKIPEDVKLISGPKMLEYVCMDYSHMKEKYNIIQNHNK